MIDRDPRVRELVVALLSATPPAPTFQQLEERTPLRRRRRRRLALILAACLMIVAIGVGVLVSRSDSGAPVLRTAGLTGRPAPDRFQVRPILSVAQPPCREGQLPLSGTYRGGMPVCFAVGPAALDGRDVASVRVSTTTADGIGIDITLTGQGMARFNALAARLVGLPSPSDEVAMAVDGHVVSNPRINTGHFDTREIRISGSFSTEAEAQRIAAAVGPTRSTNAVPQVHVTSEPNLTMHTDRPVVDAGVIEFVYDTGGGTHELRIDRVPNFRLRVPLGPTVGRVRLAPGRYVLYCDIPGHRQPGEQAVLTVAPSEPAPTVTRHSSAADTWAQIVAPYLPSGATLLPLQPPASTVLSANPSLSLLSYKLPSGNYLGAVREKVPLGAGPALRLVGPDYRETTTAGSQRVVITHAARSWYQVILQRPNGTWINLSFEKNPSVPAAVPAEFDINGLVALSDALDNTGSDLP